jgi:hypothetical protein
MMKESQSESLISESDSDDYHDSISSYQDIEGGGGDDNNIEPIPNLDIYDGDDDDDDNDEEEEDSSTIWSTMTYFSSSSTARRQRRARAVARARKDNNNDTTRVALLKLMYRQYVASQQTQNSNNPQASLWFLGKLFIVAVYFISLIEEPLDYIMGTTSSSSTENSKREAKDQNNNDDNDSITKGYIKTDLGVIHYMISKPMKPKPTPMKKQQQIPQQKPPSSSTTTTTTPTPIVCFHSSNRSLDEFYNVLPLFAARHKRQQQGQQGDEGRIVIAIDIVGFGNSSNPYTAYASIDDIATSCLLEVCDTLLLPLLPLSTTKDSNSNSSNSSSNSKTKQLLNKYIIIGSKDIGCYIATSLVCRYPQRIQSCILVNLCHPNELKISGSLLSLSLSTSTSTGGGENNNNNNISYFDLNQSSLSLNKLCVLQNKITNAILLKQRKQQGIKIQNLITYDLGRDSRRMQLCPILMIQIIRKHKRHNNRKRTENRTQEEELQDDDNDDDDDDSDPSIVISNGVRLFTTTAASGGGGGGNVKIRNFFVDADNDMDNDDDLINENAKEFVSICDEFILTSTRASASADNNDAKRV